MEDSTDIKGTESNGEPSSTSQGAIPKSKQGDKQKGPGKLRALGTSIRDTSLKLRKHKEKLPQSEQTEEATKHKGTKKTGGYKIVQSSVPGTNPSQEGDKTSKISKASKIVRKLSIGKYRPGKSKTPSPSDGSPVLSKFTRKEENSNSSSSSTNAVNIVEDFQSQEDLSSESGDCVHTLLAAAPLSCEKRSQSKSTVTKESSKMQVVTKTPPIPCDVTRYDIPKESYHSEYSLSQEQIPKSSIDKSSVHLVQGYVSEGFAEDLVKKRDIDKTNEETSLVPLVRKSELSHKENAGTVKVSTDYIPKICESPSRRKVVKRTCITAAREGQVNMAGVSTSDNFESNAPDDDKPSTEVSSPDVQSKEFLDQEKEILEKSYPKTKRKDGEDSEEEFGDAVTKEGERKPTSVSTSSQDSGRKISTEKDRFAAQQGTEKREHLYKILVIGELGTGKTSIIKRYVHQFFSQHYRATIGVDFALKVLNWDANTIIRLQLWDIAGQERFGNMTRVYYKEAVGAFVVFDVTRAATFDAVVKWKQDLDTKVQLPNGSSIPCILLANKCDQQKEGLVNYPEKMDEYCKERGFSGWFETSAKLNINIEEAAKLLVTQILQNDKLIHDNSTAKDTEKFSIDGRSDQKTTKKSCSC